MEKYIVTAKSREDLDGLYQDLETHGGTAHVPDRCVECVNRRPVSRNTVYTLTADEAQILSSDPRVLAVEPDPSDIIQVVPLRTRDGNFVKGTSIVDNTQLNWGLARCMSLVTYPGWGSDNNQNLNGYRIVNDKRGEGVDIVIADGFINPDHPEFALNEDGTGGTRVVEHNWLENFGGTYVYGPLGYGGDDNNHGAHVAGIAAGNRHGWADKAAIYNLYIYGDTNQNQGINALNYLDYVRDFHNNKGNSRPTILNNSWGSYYSFNLADIASVTNRGSVVSPAGSSFTVSELEALGVTGISFESVSGQLYARISAWLTSVAVDIQDAIDDGIIIVGSAGNDSYLIDSPDGPDYDNTVNITGSGSYYYHRGWSGTTASNAIVVGAADTVVQDRKADYSHTGPRVDVFAPGTEIVSAVNELDSPSNTVFGGKTSLPDPRDSNWRLAKISGTSMAAPQVAGVLAIIADERPTLTQAQAVEYLKLNNVSTLDDPAPESYTNYYSLQGAQNSYLTLSEFRCVITPNSIDQGESATVYMTVRNVPEDITLTYTTSGTATASDFNPPVTSDTISFVQPFIGGASYYTSTKVASDTASLSEFSLNFIRTSALLPEGGVVAQTNVVTISGTTPPSPPMATQSQYFRQNAVAQFALELQGGLTADKTITSAGTVGDQTINKIAGSVNFGVGASSLTVTNSLVTAESIIIATVTSNDTTMKSVQAVAGSGTFTLYADASATAETRVDFLIIN